MRGKSKEKPSHIHTLIQIDAITGGSNAVRIWVLTLIAIKQFMDFPKRGSQVPAGKKLFKIVTYTPLVFCEAPTPNERSFDCLSRKNISKSLLTKYVEYSFNHRTAPTSQVSLTSTTIAGMKVPDTIAFTLSLRKLKDCSERCRSRLANTDGHLRSWEFKGCCKNSTQILDPEARQLLLHL